ncbi:MAG: tRNA-guanine transglycosylase, partial [Candidatus Hydrothermarchaeales archaeon]
KYPEYAAVVQGSRYVDLRKECAEAFKDRPLLAIADSMELIGNPRMLVEIVTTIRDVISPNSALYIPFAPPHMFCLLVYMGVDLFDTGDAILNAKKGIISTQRGHLHLKKIEELPCTCNICSDKRPEDLLKDQTAILGHNFNITLSAVKEIRVAIKNNEYRELVEEKAAVSPQTMAMLRLLDKEKQGFLERYTPIAP